MVGLRRMTAEERQHPNVAHFARTAVTDWFLTCAEMHISHPAPRSPELSSAGSSRAPRRSSEGPEEPQDAKTKRRKEATTQASPEAWWVEPAHLDGAASVMHMGITLYGRRRLRCVQGKGFSASLHIVVLCFACYVFSVLIRVRASIRTCFVGKVVCLPPAPLI